MKRTQSLIYRLLILCLLSSISWSLFCSAAVAAGNATLSLSPSNGSYTVGSTLSVTIHENSGSIGINTVEADLSYNPSQLQYISSTASSNFSGNNTFVVENSGNNGLTCFIAARLGTVLTNSNAVVTVNFKVISAGNSTITFVNNNNNCSGGSSNGSAIISPSDSQNIWNSQTAAGSFTLNNPTTTTTTTTTTTQPSNPTTPTSTNSVPPRPSNSSTTATPVSNQVSQPVVAGESSKGYLVAIKVVDDKNNILVGVKVTLDTDQTAISDTEGIASFTNVSPGKHTTKAIINGKTVDGYIEVKGESSLIPQQYSIKATNPKSSSVTKPILIGTGALIAMLLLLGFIFWRKNNNRGDQFYKEVKATAVSETMTTNDPISPTPQPKPIIKNIPPNEAPTAGAIYKPNDEVGHTDQPPTNNDVSQQGS